MVLIRGLWFFNATWRWVIVIAKMPMKFCDGSLVK